MAELEANGCLVAMSEEPFAIAIVTPIAQRMHKQEYSRQIAFVDSTSSCDIDSHCITFVLCPTPAGAIPLGVVITKGQGQQVYTAGFNLLCQLLGDESFGGQGYPSVFMTDDSTAERSALQSVRLH